MELTDIQKEANNYCETKIKNIRRLPVKFENVHSFIYYKIPTNIKCLPVSVITSVLNSLVNQSNIYNILNEIY